MGDHQVRERALVHVLRGSVTCTSGVDTATCAEGTLIVFEPGRASFPTRAATDATAPRARPLAGIGALSRSSGR